MFEIGSSLRQAREHRGLDLADVERETRVRAKYLGALEEEQFDVLPGEAYVRGFMRTYAEFLGLDGNVYVSEYNEHHAQPEDELPAIQHEPLGGRGSFRLARPLVGAGIAAVAGSVLVWQLGFTSTQSQPLKTRPVTIPRTAAKKTAPAAPPGTRQQQTQTHATTGPATLVIQATRGDCWVAVRFGSETGAVVVQRTVAQGGTLRFGLARPLWVRLGAPANVDVTVRGKQHAPFPGASPVDLTAR